MRNILGYKTIHLSLLFVIISTSVNAQVIPFGILNSKRSILPSLRDNTTLVVEVTSQTGKIWMDRNLGASQVATSSTDHLAYGSLYQWGRESDGHQLINWSSATVGAGANLTTSTRSNSDSPGNKLFIKGSEQYLFDWRSGQNANLWQGVNGVNNPCPCGYRLPTQTEWEAERLSWVQAPISSTNNAAGAFASALKLPRAGFRGAANGSVSSGFSFYWSSTVSGSNSHGLFFNSSTADAFAANGRADGFSVRCLKD
jgi:uncharacterized protein (TIGR02145 family)